MLDHGWQTPNQEEVDHQIEVAGDALTADGEARRQPCRIEQRALIVGEHGPEAPQCFGRHAGAELGNVALQVGLDESVAPFAAHLVVGRREALGEATAEPQPVADFL